MRKIKTFLMFYYILDQCYEVYPEDDFGGFLGSISPEMWGDGMPVDMGILDEWNDFCNEAIIDASNILSYVYGFMEYYECNYGFDFSNIKKWIKHEADKEVVQIALKRANEKFLKHDYEERIGEK